MKKKIFIVSKIYDTEKMTDEDIRISVQTDIDRLIGENRVRFYINTTDKRADLMFFRNVDYGMTKPEVDILDADAYMICGIGLEGFKLPEMWFEPPFGYSYHFRQKEFKRCYKESAIQLGADRVKWSRLEIGKHSLVFRLK